MQRALATAVLTALVGTAPIAGASGQTTPGGGAEPGEPQVVLSTMHAMNRLEMRLGRLAEEKGATEHVRDLGERLFRDHRFADGKVAGLARSQGISLLPPERLPAAPMLQMMHEKAKQLEQASGPGFDRMFLELVIQSTEMATEMLGEAQKRLPSGPVHSLVSRLLPILHQHIALARKLQMQPDHT